MVREQLDASGGWVRCGHCMDVFDAKLQLTDAQALDLEAEVSTAPPASPQLSFVQVAKQQAFWSLPSVRASMFLTLLALIMLLCVQVLRYERERMNGWSLGFAHFTEAACAITPCTVQARRKIDGWLIEHSSFQKENASQVSSGFRLNFQLKNTSSQRLMLPHLELSLLDANDSLLVRHHFALQSDQLLPAAVSLSATTMGISEERAFSYAIQSASLSSRITSYRLVLFYP